MSSGRFAPALHIELQPSRQLGLFIIVAHLAAAAVLIQTPFAAFVVGGLLLLTTTSLFLSLVRLYSAGSAMAIDAVAVGESGDWRIRRRNGLNEEVRLCASTRSFRRVVILNFRPMIHRDAGWRPFWHWIIRPWSAIMLCDNVDPEALRRLRVRLRVG